MLVKEAIKHPLFSTISKIAKQNGQSAYVIGGFVRDFLLKRPNKADLDFVTEGSGIDLAIALSEELEGKPKVTIFKRFGTAMLKYQGMQLEFVGARRESYNSDSRKPFVERGTLEEDQKRRDFTINALAISLNNHDFGTLIDPFLGLDDLKNKIIKTPLSPDITYSDDPLRMLRAIRFSSQLNFQIEENSFNSISKNAERLEILSSERISDEINKIMLVEKPSEGFLLLEKAGLLKVILPELTDLKGVEEIDGCLHKDNFHHTLEVLDNICLVTDKLWLRWAALLHDIGKARTKKFDKKVGWTFHMHEYLGSKMVKKVFQKLKLPLAQPLKYVQKLVMLSSRPIALVSEEVSDSAIRRLLFEANDDFEDLMKLCKADITTKNPKKIERYKKNFDVVIQKASALEEKDRVRNFKPPITGEIIMKTFDLKPCKEIGQIKNQIKEAILEGEIENNYDQSYQYMMKLAKELNLNKA